MEEPSRSHRIWMDELDNEGRGVDFIILTMLGVVASVVYERAIWKTSPLHIEVRFIRSKFNSFPPIWGL